MLLAHIVYEGLLTFVPCAISSGVKDAAFVGGELRIASTMSLATDVRPVWLFAYVKVEGCLQCSSGLNPAPTDKKMLHNSYWILWNHAFRNPGPEVVE